MAHSLPLAKTETPKANDPTLGFVFVAWFTAFRQRKDMGPDMGRSKVGVLARHCRRDTNSESRLCRVKLEANTLRNRTLLPLKATHTGASGQS